MEWERLVKERDEWIAHNFPDNKLPRPQESILGMIEELGELAHSHLKELQNIRGTAEEHQANAKDAIGDTTVYLLGVLSYYEAVPSDLIPNYITRKFDSGQACIFQACKWIGMLDTDGLDRRNVAQRAGRIVAALSAYCLIRGWDYEQIVLSTWGKVKLRDWIADPVAGGEVEIG